MSGTDIFISYSRADRTVAKHLAQRFEGEGFTVWWDAALHSGETFDEVIERNLRAARAVVVLWSPRSVSSRWVRAEATLADRLGKLAPVVIEDCERPIIFQLTHTTDLTEWTGDAGDPVWRRLIDDLRRNTQRAEVASAAAPAPSVRRFDPATADARPRPVAFAPRREEVFVAAEESTTQFAVRQDDPDEPLLSSFHALEIAVDGRLERRFVVTANGLRIGRTPPSDVILADPMISRAHCLVELADDRLRVTDLRSTNGTFIDGIKVTGSAFLEIGSVLKVGKVELTHRLGSPDER
ncbi:TIR domain-containing protein [Sphingomonas sp. LHG3406-1]|uniref:TIR domain-containing protein n=1 Tax=Sphingomonas sp. LHG3406-1 TaxID=2804617 RepID=UPI002630F2B0|nr:TIR domain-containing protein [Sphingomonas sp. LHG3406-1]